MQSESAAHEAQLGTAAGAQAFVGSLLGKIRERFTEDGFQIPLSFLMVTRSPQGEILDPPKTVLVAHDFPESLGEAGKNYQAQMLHKLITELKAVGVVFVSETWFLVGEAAKAREENPGRKSIQHTPGRKEGIMVSLEHCKIPGATMWMAEITRDTNGVPTLGEFEKTEHTRATGRFAGLLSNVN